MTLDNFKANSKIDKLMRQCAYCDEQLPPLPVLSKYWVTCERCGESLRPTEIKLYLDGCIYCAHCVYCECNETEICGFCAIAGKHQDTACIASTNAAVFKMLTRDR